MRLANEICAAAMEHVRGRLRPGMKESEAAAHLAGLRPRRRARAGRGRSSWRSASRSSGPAAGSRRSPPRATCRSSRASRRCSRSGSAPTATGPTTRSSSAPASCAPTTASSSRACWTSTGARSTTASRARAWPSSTCSSATGSPSSAIPGQPTHPICHGVGARAHEPPYAHQAGGGTIEAGHGARDRAGLLLGGRRRPARRGQLPDHRDGSREALAVSRTEWCVSDLIWTGSLNDPYAIGGRVGLYDTTLRDGEQTVGVVLDPEQKLEIARLLDELGDRPDRGGLPARLRRRLAGGRTDRRGRSARRDLGLLARRAGRPGGARRARRLASR